MTGVSQTQTEREEACPYLYLLPDIGVFVLTLNVHQQPVNQGRTSALVHQGRCQLQAAVRRPPSLVLFGLKVAQRTGLDALVQ